jgi:hypothetical protein
MFFVFPDAITEYKLFKIPAVEVLVPILQEF